MTTKTPSLDWILSVAELAPDDVIAVYPYGSRVYGTNTFYSDHDFIVVVKDALGPSKDAQQYDSMNKDVSVQTYLADTWQRHLDDHKIFALECHSLAPYSQFNFALDHSLLRKEISAKASNSWVKCKKKLTVERNEEYIGLKSLFHSFRIPMFGIQIAKHGRVLDFSEANHIWDELKNLDAKSVTWEELNEKYKPRHNELMTEFRKHAEKV